MSIKKFWIRIFGIFLIWRFLLLGIGVFAVALIPAKTDFLGGTAVQYIKNPLFWGWANFDGEHYLRIAREGYRALEHAFFPLYPGLINFFSPGSYDFSLVLTGLIISHISFLVALLLLWQLVRVDFSSEIAWYTILVLLIFPTSFFFVSLYTESLFLLLSVGAFLAVRKNKWVIASLLGVLASATRIYGILLVPAFLMEWYQQRGKRSGLKTDAWKLLAVFVVSLGLFWYMFFLFKTTGNPLAFYTEQSFFGQQRFSGKIILLPQVFWRYLKMLVTVEPGLLYARILFEFLSSIFAIFLLILGYFYKLRPSYLLYAFLGYILPTLTGNFVSLPRYILALFPLFLVLGFFLRTQERWTRIIWVSLSMFLWLIQTMLFLRGYLVA